MTVVWSFTVNPEFGPVLRERGLDVYQSTFRLDVQRRGDQRLGHRCNPEQRVILNRSAALQIRDSAEGIGHQFSAVVNGHPDSDFTTLQGTLDRLLD